MTLDYVSKRAIYTDYDKRNQHIYLWRNGRNLFVRWPIILHTLIRLICIDPWKVCWCDLVVFVDQIVKSLLRHSNSFVLGFRSLKTWNLNLKTSFTLRLECPSQDRKVECDSLPRLSQLPTPQPLFEVIFFTYYKRTFYFFTYN